MLAFWGGAPNNPSTRTLLAILTRTIAASPAHPLAPQVDWVEGGVYDSIKRGYLKNLFFGISTDPEGTQLLEVRGCVTRQGRGSSCGGSGTA